ncbi:MAG: DUF2062 domain-containing protein [Verrucomicrobiota bacterium]|nr:DUF2062 domain-containing protein [Verrucomicrobiota bacterium]
MPFLSLAIPAGGQIICIIILAFFFRFNRIIAIAATWLTNPWTIPLIYPLLVKFGSFITGFKISLKEMKSFINNLHNLDLSSVFDLGTEICLNFLVGGFFTGIILSGISYLATYKLLIRHREKKAERTKLRFNLRKKKYK